MLFLLNYSELLNYFLYPMCNAPSCKCRTSQQPNKCTVRLWKLFYVKIL